MNEIVLHINKLNVYNEVAKTTAYAGFKATDKEVSYDRIFTKDEDRLMLERYWSEACNAVTGELKKFIASVSDQTEDSGLHLDQDYIVTLNTRDRYDDVLTNSIRTNLFNFFVSAIVGKWYKFINKEEAKNYILDATGLLNDVKSKLFFRTPPKRKVPNI